MKPRVIWQVPSSLTAGAFKSGEVVKGIKGGNAYELEAMRALATRFDVSADPAAIRDAKRVIPYALGLHAHRPRHCDLLIKNTQALMWGPLRVAPREVAVIHHIDWDLAATTLSWRWYFSRLIQRLRRMTAVVAVSEYWREQLLRRGCRRVEIVYNAFDLSEFEFAPGEVEATVRRFGLSTDKPLVYIGNAARSKGVEEVYGALRDAPFTLFMTGHDPDTDIPVPCLNLERRDYLCMLKASSVVLTMSFMLEGWNRVAHEAMLCGTPVVGSGSGGMRELLLGGGQVVHPGGYSLREVVEAVIMRRGELGETGRAYASRLNSDYFTRAWLALADDLLAGAPAGGA